MWNLIHLKCDNFKSFESVDIEIDNGCKVIKATNLDDEGADSNGSGKTNFIEAMMVSLVGIPDRKLKKKDFVRNDYDEAYLMLKLQNRDTGQVMVIKRILRASKSNSCLVAVDGIQVDQAYDEEQTNKYILEVLGLTKEEILKFFIVRYHETSFFDLTDKNKLDILMEFVDSQNVDLVCAKLSAQLAETDKNITAAQLKAERSLGAAETLQSRLNEIDRKIKLGEDSPEFKNVNEEIAKYRALAKKHGNVEKGAEDQVIKDMENSLNELRALEKKARSEHRSLSNQSSSISSKISGAIECPQCSHVFNPLSKEDDIEELKKQISEIDKNSSASQKESREASALISETSEVIDELKAKNLQFKRSKAYAVELMEKISLLQESLVNLNSEIKAERSAVFNDLKSKKKAADEMLQKFSELKEEKLLLKSSIFALEKQFKFRIINSLLSEFEIKLNELVEMFGIGIFVDFKGFKVLSNGETRESVNCQFFKNSELFDFKKLSTGQRARLNICAVVVFNQMINEKAGFGKGLNLLCIDEAFYGVDDTGQVSAVNLLAGLSHINSFLVTPQQDSVSAANTIRITMKEKVSHVQKEEIEG